MDYFQLAAFNDALTEAEMSQPAQLGNTGLLLYPPIECSPQGITLSYADSDEQLRFFLLYFDNIRLIPLVFMDAFPTVCFASEQEQLAVRQGMVSAFPPRIVLISESNANFIVNDASRVFRIANSGLDGRWALASPAGFRTDKEAAGWNSATIVLSDFLPAPSIDVALSETIDFRERNRELLGRLRSTIDEMFLFLDPDGSADRDLVPLRLRDLAEQVKAAMQKAGLPFATVGLSISKRIEPEVLAGFPESEGAGAGMPLIASFLDGAISVTARNSSLARSSERYPADYEYVYLGTKRRLAPDGSDSSRGKVRQVGPLRYDNSMLSSYFPREPIPETAHANGLLARGSTGVATNLHSREELGEFFEAWSRYYQPDQDSSLDAK